MSFHGSELSKSGTKVTKFLKFPEIPAGIFEMAHSREFPVALCEMRQDRSKVNIT